MNRRIIASEHAFDLAKNNKESATRLNHFCSSLEQVIAWIIESHDNKPLRKRLHLASSKGPFQLAREINILNFDDLKGMKLYEILS